MATYYVRKTGNDGSAGTASGTAWATVTKALTTVAAGDTVYVGAGVYRETVAITVTGSAGNIINVIGDTDGSHTGDAGQITLTQWTTNSTTAPSGTELIGFGTSSYISFSNITFLAGGGFHGVTNTAGCTHITFTDCVFNMLSATVGDYWVITGPTNGTALAWTFDRCTMAMLDAGAKFSLPSTTSGSADYDALCVVRNCLILSVAGPGIWALGDTTNTYNGGGVRIYNCTIFTGGNALQTQPASGISTTVPCEIHNSLCISQHDAVLYATTSGQITEDHNVLLGETPRTLVSVGTGSQVSPTYEPAVDLGQFFKWSGGVGYQPFMAPDAGSGLLGFGAAATPPTVDFNGRPRPSGGGSSSHAVGYLERHDFAIEDASVYNDSPASGKLVGPGDQYIYVPVDAAATVITIALRYDSYGGTNYPSATILANPEIGVTAQTVTATTSASGAFEVETFTTQTPTAAGVVTIQIQSFDTNGTGTVHFDTLTAT